MANSRAVLVDLRVGGFVGVGIDKKASKCNGDLEVCCDERDILIPAPRKPVKPRRPNGGGGGRQSKSKCGVHNPDGIEIRVANQVSSTFTQFGEWPHMCMILRVSRRKTGGPDGSFASPGFFQESLVGGASLIAPGIVLTAAHKIM